MDVVRLRWPQEDPRRSVLRSRGVPRLLLIEADARPPADVDVLEDWARADAPAADLRAREVTLALRAIRRPPAPHFDDDGLLRYGRELVLLSPLESRLAHVLVAHLGQVVAPDTVAEAGWPDGTPVPNTVAVTLRRLRDRLRPAGLALTAVASRGWMLETALAGA
jgi:hypothetical protein